jgi:hypothetical protein
MTFPIFQKPLPVSCSGRKIKNSSREQLPIQAHDRIHGTGDEFGTGHKLQGDAKVFGIFHVMAKHAKQVDPPCFVLLFFMDFAKKINISSFHLSPLFP